MLEALAAVVAGLELVTLAADSPALQALWDCMVPELVVVNKID